MPTNPFKHGSEQARAVEGSVALDLATVEAVSDGSTHQIRCRVMSPEREGETVNALMAPSVLIGQHGDITLPTVGNTVLVGYIKDRNPVILGTVYTREDAIPSFSPGQRTIGHPPTAANITINPDGSVDLTSASGQDITVNNRSVEEPLASPLSIAHQDWGTGNNQEEIWRIDLQSDETLRVYRLATTFKGGGTDPDFSVDIYDVDAGQTIASTTDVVRGQPAGESGQGNTVIARLTNDTGSTQTACLSSRLSIKRDL